LNEKYRREELEDEPPVLLSCGFVEKPIPTEEFSTQVDSNFSLLVMDYVCCLFLSVVCVEMGITGQM